MIHNLQSNGNGPSIAQQRQEAYSAASLPSPL